MENNTILFNALRNAVELVSLGKTVIELMTILRDESFSKIELMIIDSVIKKMPLENLWNTLILNKDEYLYIIEDIIIKLLNVSERYVIEKQEDNDFMDI